MVDLVNHIYRQLRIRRFTRTDKPTDKPSVREKLAELLLCG